MGMSRIEVDKDLQPGTKVRLVSGPLSGMIGKVDSIDTANSIVNLTVDLFGQETSVEATLTDIEVLK